MSNGGWLTGGTFDILPQQCHFSLSIQLANRFYFCLLRLLFSISKYNTVAIVFLGTNANLFTHSSRKDISSSANGDIQCIKSLLSAICHKHSSPEGVTQTKKKLKEHIIITKI